MFVNSQGEVCMLSKNILNKAMIEMCLLDAVACNWRLHERFGETLFHNLSDQCNLEDHQSVNA